MWNQYFPDQNCLFYTPDWAPALRANNLFCEPESRFVCTSTHFRVTWKLLVRAEAMTQINNGFKVLCDSRVCVCMLSEGTRLERSTLECLLTWPSLAFCFKPAPPHTHIHTYAHFHSPIGWLIMRLNPVKTIGVLIESSSYTGEQGRVSPESQSAACLCYLPSHFSHH